MFNCHVVFNKRRRKEKENNNKKNKQTSAALVAPSETGTQKNCLSWGARTDLCIPCWLALGSCLGKGAWPWMRSSHFFKPVFANSKPFWKQWSKPSTCACHTLEPLGPGNWFPQCTLGRMRWKLGWLCTSSSPKSPSLDAWERLNLWPPSALHWAASSSLNCYLGPLCTLDLPISLCNSWVLLTWLGILFSWVSSDPATSRHYFREPPKNLGNI